VSPLKLPKPDPPTPFWKRTEARVALVAGFFTILAAVLNSCTTLFKKNEPPAAPAAVTSSNSNQVAVTNSAPVTVNTPVTVNNNISQAPVNPTSTDAKHPVLEQFALNPSESFFEPCNGRNCTFGRWSGKAVHWVPSNEYWRFSGADYARSPADDKKYKDNPSFYDKHFQPVFDVVISNPLPRPVVLTAIDVIVYRQTEFAAGDGEEPPNGGVIKVMNRYTVPFGNFTIDPPKYPVTETTPALPPLEIAPNRPGRFQLALDNKLGAIEINDIRLRFHFGANGTVQTDRFRLTF
jgi:hypothetical protein